MDLQTIIAEADARIPNSFTSLQKINWLNEVNNEFFDVVKVPVVYTQYSDGTKDTFTKPGDCVEKNIRKIVTASGIYRSMVYDNPSVSTNYYLVNISDIWFSNKPAAGSIYVIYDKISSFQFTSGSLNAAPEAPVEYHWIYILGLCARIAKAMNDVTLANNYDADYKNNLNVAQQNYQRGQANGQG